MAILPESPPGLVALVAAAHRHRLRRRVPNLMCWLSLFLVGMSYVEIFVIVTFYVNVSCFVLCVGMLSGSMPPEA